MKAAIEKGELKILPESRKTEMLNLMKIALSEKKILAFRRWLQSAFLGHPRSLDPLKRCTFGAILYQYITAIDYEHEGESFKKFW